MRGALCQCADDARAGKSAFAVKSKAKECVFAQPRHRSLLPSSSLASFLSLQMPIVVVCSARDGGSQTQTSRHEQARSSAPQSPRFPQTICRHLVHKRARTAADLFVLLCFALALVTETVFLRCVRSSNKRSRAENQILFWRGCNTSQSVTSKQESHTHSCACGQPAHHHARLYPPSLFALVSRVGVRTTTTQCTTVCARHHHRLRKF